MQGWRVAGFTEVRELGAGAQGRVVLARHDASGGFYAIKYVFSPGPGFQHEARLLSQVTGPYVARLFEFLEEPGRGAAMVLEAVPGVPLRDLLAARGALEPETSLAILKGSLLGLAAAHAVRIVHRDYKPANVIVPGDGPSKLIDFGIATPVGATSRSGTPAYMAPEQWRGDPAGPATDVYAATCVFFECLTGNRPYQGGDGTTLMGQHTTAPIPVADAPPAVRELIAHGMAKDAADRPAGAAEFVTELERVAVAGYGPDWEARGWRRLAEAAATLLAVSPLVAALVQGGASAGSGLAVGTASTAGMGAAGAGAGTAGAGAAGAAGAGSAIVSKVAIGAVALAIAGGAGTVVVRQATSAKPHITTTATANRSPSATPLSVTSCTNLNAQFGGPAAQGTVPPTVQVPALVKLPRGASVGGVNFEAGGRPAYVIGQGGQSCSYSIGADGGMILRIGSSTGYEVNGIYSPGGVGVVESESCAVFGDVVPSLKAKLQTVQTCNADPARTAGRRVLQTGVPAFHAALLKNTPSPPPAGPYVSVSLEVLNTDPNPLPRSIECTMPVARADICTAALTYFLVQVATGMSQTTLSALAGNISAYVAANHT